MCGAGLNEDRPSWPERPAAKDGARRSGAPSVASFRLVRAPARGEEGTVVAEAEAAWPGAKIAVLLSGEGLSDAFYQDERRQVVLARGVTTEEEYRRVSRVGRGTRLSRADRVKVWRVFRGVPGPTRRTRPQGGGRRLPAHRLHPGHR